MCVCIYICVCVCVCIFSPKFPNSHKKEGVRVGSQASRKLGDWEKLKKKDPSQ